MIGFFSFFTIRSYTIYPKWNSFNIGFIVVKPAKTIIIMWSNVSINCSTNFWFFFSRYYIFYIDNRIWMYCIMSNFDIVRNAETRVSYTTMDTNSLKLDWRCSLISLGTQQSSNLVLRTVFFCHIGNGYSFGT